MGGALEIQESSATLIGTTISKHPDGAAYGGAIFVATGGTQTLVDCMIANCTTTSDAYYAVAGGIYTDSTSLFLNTDDVCGQFGCQPGIHGGKRANRIGVVDPKLVRLARGRLHLPRPRRRISLDDPSQWRPALAVPARYIFAIEWQPASSWRPRACRLHGLRLRLPSWNDWPSGQPHGIARECPATTRLPDRRPSCGATLPGWP